MGFEDITISNNKLNLTLSLPSENDRIHGETQDMHPQAISINPISSLFNYSGVKRERDISSYEEVKIEKASLKVVDDHQDEEGGGARKKLRLTKKQSLILEDNFKLHSNPNTTQKQELATRLNLRPRQIEVWFQNRRARTKVKQIEVEYELLKKSCEKLTDENRRLHKELQELKFVKSKIPTLSLCPSCDKIIGTRLHFVNPFTMPSQAC